MAKKQTFLITVFSTAKDQDSRVAIAKRFAMEVAKVCPDQVAHVHPDQAKLAMLAQGEFDAIVKALNSTCQQKDESWLLAQVGKPCTANGLSRAVAWIQTRNSGP